MKIKPCELKDANAFVQSLHRHHKKVQGHRFSISAVKGDKVVGVAIIGRPVARMTDHTTTLEVTRTDGTKNCCSFLYSAAARIGKEMGYNSIQTFILKSEPGTSLIASGWNRISDSNGGTWSRPSRGRIDKAPLEQKVKYAKTLH